jgi:hypothetical protein
MPFSIRFSVQTLLLAACCLAGQGCFRVSSDSAALRDSLLEAVAGGDAKTTIEFGVGGLPFMALRAGLAHVEMPEEPRVLLESLRGAEAGVYQIRGTTDLAGMLEASDRSMARRGWTRMVGVLERDQLVAIYLPREASSGNSLKVTVVVVQQDQMVIAAARSNLEPLMQFAQARAFRMAAAQ